MAGHTQPPAGEVTEPGEQNPATLEQLAGIWRRQLPVMESLLKWRRAKTIGIWALAVAAFLLAGLLGWTELGVKAEARHNTALIGCVNTSFTEFTAAIRQRAVVSARSSAAQAAEDTAQAALDDTVNQVVTLIGNVVHLTSPGQFRAEVAALETRAETDRRRYLAARRAYEAAQAELRRVRLPNPAPARCR